MKYVLSLFACLSFAVANVYADETTGKADFAKYCASCHGPEGQQPKEEYSRAADLTQLSVNYGGHFPYAKVRVVIDGRPSEGNIRSHDSDMPVWGNVFRAETAGSGAQLHGEAVAKMKILNLIDYLLSIQAEDPYKR